MLGLAVGAGASALGGFLQNRSNRRESARDRRFQERMSSTAYQRSVRDMKAAGLNPMLAYEKGGASTPGGSKANFANPLEQTASSAMQLKRNREEVKLLKAQTAKTMSEKLNLDQNLGIKGPASATADSLQNMIEDIKANVPSITNNLNSARSFATNKMVERDIVQKIKNAVTQSKYQKLNRKYTAQALRKK